MALTTENEPTTNHTCTQGVERDNRQTYTCCLYPGVVWQRYRIMWCVGMTTQEGSVLYVGTDMGQAWCMQFVLRGRCSMVYEYVVVGVATPVLPTTAPRPLPPGWWGALVGRTILPPPRRTTHSTSCFCVLCPCVFSATPRHPGREQFMVVVVS